MEEREVKNNNERINSKDIQQISRSEIASNRHKIKNPISKKGFTNYVFNEFPKIKKYTRWNKILKFRFFVFGTLDSLLATRFNNRIKSPAAICGNSLRLVFEEGWRYLNKGSYNKLRLINDLIELIEEFDSRILVTQSPPNILKSLRKLETSFYVLVSDTSILNELQRELENYYDQTRDNDFPVEYLIRQISDLLAHNAQALCLSSLFVALNSLVYQCFCPLQKLINHNAGELFYTEDFELSDPIRQKVLEYCNHLVKIYKKNYESYSEITLFKDFLPSFDPNVHSNLYIVEEFYNSVLIQSTENTFVHDFENLVDFLFNFSQKVQEAITPILVSELNFSNSTRHAIFNPIVFSNNLIRIRQIESKLGDRTRRIQLFRRSYYLQLLQGQSGAGEFLDLTKLISELLGIYFHIAQVLAHVLKFSSKSKSDIVHPPVNQINFKEIQFFIPFENEYQYSSSYFLKMTIRETLHHIASLFFTLCVELRETNMMTLIRSEKDNYETLRRTIQEIRWITPSLKFQELNRQLNFDSIIAR